MRGSYCYLPLLKARDGQFKAVGTVSPTARSRFAPLFDVEPPNARQAANTKGYLEKKVHGIKLCWVPDRPVYVDAHNFPVDMFVDGRRPVALVCEGLRAHGFSAVPVTGAESERGRDYVVDMGRLASRVGNGICLRIEHDDIIDAQLFYQSVSSTLDAVRIPVEGVDLVLDLGFVGKSSELELHSTLLEVFQVIASLGVFRNVVIAGGSVPEQLPKRDAGIVRRETRIEIPVWSRVHSTPGLTTPIAFGDYGVINPQYVKPGRPVNVPARVRYTTPSEQVFLRTGRGGHAELCRQLTAMEDYAGAGYSAGDQRISLAAQGLASPGNPAIWVAGDLNHHLELVSDQVWQMVCDKGLAAQYSLPEPQRYPWLQPVLIE